jgi:predicted transposase/invertase (TIGR01784 family)
MKTDKLFYRIFLNQPSLLAELIPGLPVDCKFDYTAPVIKEQEFRLDGVLTPLSKDPKLPLVFLEAQMQADPDFYGRYFAEIYLYLKQYKSNRPWRGLLILKSRKHYLGSENSYQFQLDSQVHRLYLQDLLNESSLSPNLALLQLIVLPKAKTPQAAQDLLKKVKTESEFRQQLDLIEAILVNKFPKLSLEEILKMLDLKTADITQTRFYQDVFQEGKQEGEQKGEVSLILRLLTRRFGEIQLPIKQQIQSLSISQLELLGESLLDFSELQDLVNYLAKVN